MRTIVPSNCSSSIQITQFTSWRHTVALRFFASAAAYKDILGEHRLCPKACCSTCFTSFCSSTCSSNFKCFGNSPSFEQKLTSHDVFIKAQTNCMPQKSSCRIHCPFVSMVKLIWTKKAVQLIFGEFFKRLVHFQSWSLTYFE